jgi:hypothetical protein
MDNQIWTTVDDVAGSNWGISSEAFSPPIATREAEQERWRAAFGMLARLHDLRPNWDEENAPALNLLCLATARRLLEKIESEAGSAPDRIVPAPGGEILIEWHAPGFYLEAEIATPWIVEWMEQVEDRPAQHWDWDLFEDLVSVSFARAAGDPGTDTPFTMEVAA